MHVDPEHRATEVVDVIVVAVISRAHRNDRLQRLRLVARQLKRVEPAPADAKHTDLAGAPVLLGDPLDHLEPVVVFLLIVFVPRNAFTAAVATNIYADGRVTVACIERVAFVVARRCPVTVAVWKVLKDRWNRLICDRHPSLHPQPGAVAERNPVFNNLDVERKVFRF